MKGVLCLLFLKHFIGQLFNAYPNQIQILFFSCQNRIKTGSYTCEEVRNFDKLVLSWLH
jgi:hypothetical protein